jgi:hypothetical protein
MICRIVASLVFAVLLMLPVSARACPLCKDAISTPSADDEINNLPRAYNNSIYLMIGVPYLTLGLVGFAIYRGVRQNTEFRESQFRTEIQDRR